MIARVLWLSLVALATGGDEFDAGLRAYREQRFDQALKHFQAAQIAAGDAAPVELWYDLALAALQTGDVSAAEQAARRCSERGKGRFDARAAFLLGNVAYLRCEKAEVQARGPEAEPFAWDAAIALGESAAGSFIDAATRGNDWPAARRNAERALRKIADLLRQKDASQPPAPKQEPEPEPPPEPDPTAPAPSTEAGQLDLARNRLGPERIQRMLEWLAQKEKDKRAVRETQRAARSVDVEKDW